MAQYREQSWRDYWSYLRKGAWNYLMAEGTSTEICLIHEVITLPPTALLSKNVDWNYDMDE